MDVAAPTPEDHLEEAAWMACLYRDLTADGEGLVAHAGSALPSQVAYKTGLTRAPSEGPVRDVGAPVPGHDPGRVVRDLAVILADGGDCLADPRAVHDHDRSSASLLSTPPPSNDSADRPLPTGTA